MRRLCVALIAVVLLAGCSSNEPDVVVPTAQPTTSLSREQECAETLERIESATDEQRDTEAYRDDVAAYEGGCGDESSAGSSVDFKMPSGRIFCSMFQYQSQDQPGTTNGVRCDIGGATWEAPPQPADCEFDWGPSLGVATGEPGSFLCVSDSVANEVAPTLNYGDTQRLGEITCTSSEANVRCLNDTGNGFELSRAAYRLF